MIYINFVMLDSTQKGDLTKNFRDLFINYDFGVCIDH